MAVSVIVKDRNNIRCIELQPKCQIGWKNEDGTSDLKPSLGDNWKDYWEKHSGRCWPKKCSVLFCYEEAKVGAHVINPEVSPRDFILPMCKECNSSFNEQSMILKDGTILVDANL